MYKISERIEFKHCCYVCSNKDLLTLLYTVGGVGTPRSYTRWWSLQSDVTTHFIFCFISLKKKQKPEINNLTDIWEDNETVSLNVHRKKFITYKFEILFLLGMKVFIPEQTVGIIF